MIPIIDFEDSNHLKHIEEAYTTVGFAIFKNCLSVKDRTNLNYWFIAMKQFFDLPLETKKLYSYNSENNLGYSIMGAENVDPTAPKDMKESYNFNNTRMPDELWPHGWVPGFKYKAEQAIRIADTLSLDILQKFDTILGCGTTLLDAHQEMYNTTRIIHYPAYEGTLEDRQMRIGEHSDYGTITLLWQVTDVPGLEVQDLKGEWHPVTSVKSLDEGEVVVNIGDLLQRLTNDYFISTKHRVVNSHIHLPRYSMPHFVDPTPGTIVKNLTNEPAKYEPIESKEYLMWRLSQSY